MYTLHSIVGRPLLKPGENTDGVVLKDVMVCDETTEHRSMLELTYPLKEGTVENWDDMMLVWDYAFNEKLHLKDFSEKNILLTEAA